MANETTASCRGPAAKDPKSEPDESSYMLRDKSAYLYYTQYYVISLIVIHHLHTYNIIGSNILDRPKRMFVNAST